MKMKTTKYILTIALALLCAWSNSFAIDQSYYSSVDGKSGKNLFDAVHAVSKTGYKSLSYNDLWTAYCSIDINPSGYVWDMYSNATTYTCGSSAQGANSSKEGDAYNREHSIPKSWFGGSESSNTPGTDIFHVVPVDGYNNTMRSNQPYGEVSAATYTSKSGCKKGTPKSITISNTILSSGSSTQSCSNSPVFEPLDEYKGDFARGYFGTMIRWANGDYQTFTTLEGAQIFNTAYDAAHYYGLTAYGVALLVKWHRMDPVSQKEIDRNNGIENQQGNRNPFIDYPELVEYLWGEHSGETVVLASLTSTFTGYTPPEATTYTVILSRNGVTEAVSGITGEYTLPASSAAACDGWTFAGWSTTKVTSTTSTPSFVDKVSSATTVYAVYSKATSSSAPKHAKMADVEDVLTRATTGVSGTNYDTWSNKTSTSDAVYAGNSAGGNDAIQLRSNNSNSGIVTTASGGKAKKVVVYWHSETQAGRTLNIYGKNSAYSAATNLYNSTSQGTLLGTIVKGTSTTLTISGDYEYIGMRSSSGAMYLTSVSITWSSGGGSGTTYDSEPEDCKCSGKLGTPNVNAAPGDGMITLTWPDVDGATNGYSVTVSKGVGYTTECGDMTIGEITHSGTTNTCVISGLINGLAYTTSVVANETATTCTSDADEDTTTPADVLPTTVTVTFHKNDGSATTTSQTIPYNTPTPLAANTFSRTDYTFQGWATSSSGEKVYDDGDEVTFTSNQNLYAVWQKNPPKTYEIKFFNMGTQVGETQHLSVGATATIPDPQTACEGYTFLGWWATELPKTNTTTHTWITSDFTIYEAANKNYYAVYKQVEDGGSSAFDGSTPGDYKIYAVVDGTKYYAKGTGGKIASTTNAEEATEYTFAQVTGGWTIKTGTTYIKYKSSSDLGTSTDPYTWTLSKGTKGTHRLTSETDGRAWIFRAGTTNQFGGYSTGNVTTTSEYYDLEIGDGATYYTTSPDCEECLNKVTLTKGTPEHGTFSLDKTGEQENCAAGGLVVTVSDITPADNYQFKEITQTGIATGVTIDQENKTVTYDKDVSGSSTINVVFEPKPTYTIRFYNNGVQIGSSQTVVSGNSPTVPANPTGCEGYSFVGWWTAELAETNTASKTWITDFTATTDQDYYAIFEHNEGGGGSGGTVTFDFAQIAAAESWGSETDGHNDITIAPVNIKVTKGSASYCGRWWSDGTWRIYNHNTITITSTGNNITAVTSEADVTANFNISEGKATLNATVTYKFTSISVTYGSSSTTYYTSTTNCCTDVPSDVVISPSLKGATIRWQAESATATVRVYSDAEGSTLVSAEEEVTSPYTISGLEENTTYYVRILAGGTCATVLHPFTTQQTTVDVVEWQPNGIVIDLIAGDGVSVIIEDQQIINPSDPAHVAEDIFFSKYFEASGSTKLLGLYNGTDHAIDISDLVICSGIQGSTNWSWSATKASGTSHVVLGDITKLKNQYGDGAGHIMLPPNTEIILYSLKDDNESYYTGEGCMDEYYSWSDLAANNVDNWYRIGKTNVSGSQKDDDGHYPMVFAGAHSIGLRRAGTLIDIIGAGTNTTPGHGTVENHTKHTLGNGRVINKPNDDLGYFCEDGMAPPDETNPDGYTTYLTTNRCLLVRKNTVVSGANSLTSNGTTFATLCTEWLGVPVGDDGTAQERSCQSGNLFGYVGNYNYGEYYGEFEEIETLDDLTGYRNEDGTYSIPISGLDNLACSNLRIKVSEGGEEKASYVYKVPIMVETNTDMTTSEIFSKFNTSICKECDVVILDGATLTKENDTEHTEKNRDEIRNLTIYPGGTLVVPEGAGDYTVNSIQFRVKDDTNAPVAKLSGNLITKNSQVIVTRRINNDRYYFFSLPYDCNVADVRWTDGLTPVKGVEYEIVEYDGETRAIEGSGKGTAAHWKPVANDATLKAGVGYNIAVSSKKPKELVFPMSLSGTNLTTAENNKTATTDIHQYTNAATTINNHNWNLVAHPFVTAFSPYEGDVITAGVLSYANEEWTRQETSSVYITMPTYDTSKKKITYTQKLASSIDQLDPFLAVFVQGVGEGDLTFAQESRKQSAPARYWAARAETQDESIFVGITLSSNELSDETALRIRPDFTDEYQLGYDLEKFITFYTSRPQVYMNTATYKLAFQAVNDSTAAANFLPVGVYCYEAGTYTFALNEQYPLDEVEAVYLYDKTTGQTTNLLYDTYSFTTEKQVYTGKRFALNVIVKRRTPEITTDLPATESTREAVRKVLIGGHVYILRGGQLYHITGQQL